MTPLLIFPPAASPIYIPLGLLYLKAYMEKERSPGSVAVIDLNIRLWNRVADSEEAFVDYRSFTKGEKGFSSETYLQPYLAVRQN